MGHDFVEALSFVKPVGPWAEAEEQHRDKHLTHNRLVRSELTTHAMGGLSENDFILAA